MLEKSATREELLEISEIIKSLGVEKSRSEAKAQIDRIFAKIYARASIRSTRDLKIDGGDSVIVSWNKLMHFGTIVERFPFVASKIKGLWVLRVRKDLTDKALGKYGLKSILPRDLKSDLAVSRNHVVVFRSCCDSRIREVLENVKDMVLKACEALESRGSKNGLMKICDRNKIIRYTKYADGAALSLDYREALKESPFVLKNFGKYCVLRGDAKSSELLLGPSGLAKFVKKAPKNSVVFSKSYVLVFDTEVAEFGSVIGLCSKVDSNISERNRGNKDF